MDRLLSHLSHPLHPLLLPPPLPLLTTSRIQSNMEAYAAIASSSISTLYRILAYGFLQVVSRHGLSHF